MILVICLVLLCGSVLYALLTIGAVSGRDCIRDDIAQEKAIRL